MRRSAGFFAGVESARPDRERVIVLTADHGEFFGEFEEFGHNEKVYQPLLHVPLVISGALDSGLIGSRVEQPVEIRSVAATLSRIAGVPSRPFSGSDLVELARGASEDTFAYAEGSHAWGGSRDSPTAILGDRWKLILHLARGTTEFYDLAADPHEREDLWRREDRDPVAPALKGKVAEFTLRMRRKGLRAERRAIELPEVSRDHLRMLGYAE